MNSIGKINDEIEHVLILTCEVKQDNVYACHCRLSQTTDRCAIDEMLATYSLR
jgi:hypothetical protein